MEFEVKIEYCEPCRFEKQADQLSEEIRTQFAGKIGAVTLHPTHRVGCFDVFLNGEMVFSKKNKGRLPHPGEVEQELLIRLMKEK